MPRYRLTNKDTGPRYVFTTEGVAPTVSPGQTSDPLPISDVEIEAAREAVSAETGHPIWEIEEVQDEAEAEPKPKARNKMNRDELVAEVTRLREAGTEVTLLGADGNALAIEDGKSDLDSDKATKAVLLAAIEKADPSPSN